MKAQITVEAVMEIGMAIVFIAIFWSVVFPAFCKAGVGLLCGL